MILYVLIVERICGRYRSVFYITLSYFFCYIGVTTVIFSEPINLSLREPIFLNYSNPLFKF